MMRCLPISRRWAGCISVCPATICGKGQTGSPLASSAPSTIPWPASNSWHSQCSHYVRQIVVWRTNLEVTPPAGMPLADHITIKETGVMLAVRVVVGCEILKALDHLENVGLRVLVQRRDALRNHGATSHTHRSPRNVVQRRDGGDLVSCRFHFPHSFRRSRCLRPAALTRWRSAGWGGGSKIDGSGAGGTAREAPALARAGTGRTWRATRSCRLCFGNERAGALGVPPVAAATTGNARPWPPVGRAHVRTPGTNA